MDTLLKGMPLKEFESLFASNLKLGRKSNELTFQQS